jgi:hypothetical protein
MRLNLNKFVIYARKKVRRGARPTPSSERGATVLRLLSIDHERFTYRAQGLDFKLTGVEIATVVKAELA